MEFDKLFLVADIPGFTPQIGRLVSMMNYARWTTLQTVKKLTTEQLDYLHDSRSNSIGALLRHAAAVEVSYQVHTFEKRELNKQEKEQWSAALDLGDRGRAEIKGYSLEDYTNCLNEVRENTLAGFRQREDEWLYEETSWWYDKQANNYFKWFHVYEDEINHRGQMRWLRSRLPS